jgi:hypothetical protein
MLPHQYIRRARLYIKKLKEREESKRLILICKSCNMEQEVFSDQLDEEGFWDCPYCYAENETYGCGLGGILQNK